VQRTLELSNSEGCSQLSAPTRYRPGRPRGRFGVARRLNKVCRAMAPGGTNATRTTTWPSGVPASAADGSQLPCRVIRPPRQATRQFDDTLKDHRNLRSEATRCSAVTGKKVGGGGGGGGGENCPHSTERTDSAP